MTGLSDSWPQSNVFSIIDIRFCYAVRNIFNFLQNKIIIRTIFFSFEDIVSYKSQLRYCFFILRFSRKCFCSMWMNVANERRFLIFMNVLVLINENIVD